MPISVPYLIILPLLWGLGAAESNSKTERDAGHLFHMTAPPKIAPQQEVGKVPPCVWFFFGAAPNNIYIKGTVPISGPYHDDALHREPKRVHLTVNIVGRVSEELCCFFQSRKCPVYGLAGPWPEEQLLESRRWIQAGDETRLQILDAICSEIARGIGFPVTM